jgi:hypothetical protein
MTRAVRVKELDDSTTGVGMSWPTAYSKLLMLATELELEFAHKQEKVDELTIDLAKKDTKIACLKKDIEFLLALCPEWAKTDKVPEGMCPMFYGTLSEAGDKTVAERVNRIKKELSK